MRRFGLIGYPLGHSFSKQYFTGKFLLEKIAGCQYENFELDDLSSFPDLISGNDELEGLNVTIPHKTGIMKFLDEIDHEALNVGAVNTIKITRSGGRKNLKGFNTDIYGFKESLLTSAFEIPESALILGTGGSSKAVSYVLRNLGLEIKFVSRDSGKGTISYAELIEADYADNLLIVNTTPLGMFPETGTFPDIRYDLLGEKHILYDLVYNPEMTLFLQKGAERGCRIIGGERMLILQAEKSWSIWNDDSV